MNTDILRIGAHTGRLAPWPMILACIVAASLGASAFVRTLDNEFVYDDWAFIVQNPVVNSPGPWYRFWTEPYWPRGSSADKLYRPLTTCSYRLNMVLAGHDVPDPVAFHLVNLVLHVFACIGVVVLTYRLTGRALAGLLAGALFATHPVHTEAVVTGYGRGELLAGVFAVWLLVRHIRPPDRDRPRSLWFHLISGLLLLAALMSKENAVLVWPVIILIDWSHRWRTAPSDRPSLRKWFNQIAAPSHTGFILACAAFFFLRFAVFGQFYRLDSSRVRFWESPVAHADLMEHLLTPFRLLWLTLEVFVWPGRLCPIWSIPALPLADHLAWDVVAGMILFVLLLVLIGVLWKRRSPGGVLLVSLLILLAIPTHALPLAHWLYAERWLYLPSIFVAVLVGAGLARLGRIGPAVGLAAAIVLLPSTWQYASRFADSLTMNREVVSRQPDNFQGRRNLASILYLMGKYPEAIQAANEMIERFEPPASDPYLILLKSYLELGEGRRALEALNTYEWIRRDIPEPSLQHEREQAEALIAAEKKSN